MDRLIFYPLLPEIRPAVSTAREKTPPGGTRVLGVEHVRRAEYAEANGDGHGGQRCRKGGFASSSQHLGQGDPSPAVSACAGVEPSKGGACPGSCGTWVTIHGEL